MGSAIVYKPHCGKCGAIIDGDVSFRPIHVRVNEFRPFAFETYEICPNVCKECGAIFDVIEIKNPECLPTERFN